MEFQLYEPNVAVGGSVKKFINEMGGAVKKKLGALCFTAKIAEGAPPFEFTLLQTGGRAYYLEGYFPFGEAADEEETDAMVAAVYGRLTELYGRPQKEERDSFGRPCRTKWIDGYTYMTFSAPRHGSETDEFFGGEDPVGGTALMIVTVRFTEKEYRFENKPSPLQGAFYGAFFAIVMFFCVSAQYGYGWLNVSLCVGGGILAGVLFYLLNFLLWRHTCEIKRFDKRTDEKLTRAEAADGLCGYEKKFVGLTAMDTGRRLKLVQCNLYILPDEIAFLTVYKRKALAVRDRYDDIMLADTEESALVLTFGDGTQLTIAFDNDLVCDEIAAIIGEKQKGRKEQP